MWGFHLAAIAPTSPGDHTVSLQLSDDGAPVILHSGVKSDETRSCHDIMTLTRRARLCASFVFFYMTKG